MSMPMLVSDLEPVPPIMPMLRLADDVCDDADAAPAAEPAATVNVVDRRLFADDGATLPTACVVCGDTVGAIALVTPRGRIGFSICREHAFSALARVACGAVVCFVAACLLVKGTGGAASKVLSFAGVSVVGAALIASAIPVWTWRERSPTRVFSVNRDVVERIEHASR